MKIDFDIHIDLNNFVDLSNFADFVDQNEIDCFDNCHKFDAIVVNIDYCKFAARIKKNEIEKKIKSFDLIDFDNHYHNQKSCFVD